MKFFIIIFSLIFILPTTYALGIGVVPDKLVFDGKEQAFRIINPNEIAVDFEVISDKIECNPYFGSIYPKSEQEIKCNAEKLENDTIIIVETYVDDGESLGVLPAIAIKAMQHNNITANVPEKAEPLEINGQSDDEANENKEINEDKTDYTPEITSIALMIAGIISILSYNYIKRKKDSSSDLCAPSQQDAQDNQPSP